LAKCLIESLLLLIPVLAIAETMEYIQRKADLCCYVLLHSLPSRKCATMTC